MSPISPSGLRSYADRIDRERAEKEQAAADMKRAQEIWADCRDSDTIVDAIARALREGRVGKAGA